LRYMFLSVTRRPSISISAQMPVRSSPVARDGESATRIRSGFWVDGKTVEVGEPLRQQQVAQTLGAIDLLREEHVRPKLRQEPRRGLEVGRILRCVEADDGRDDSRAAPASRAGDRAAPRAASATAPTSANPPAAGQRRRTAESAAAASAARPALRQSGAGTRVRRARMPGHRARERRARPSPRPGDDLAACPEFCPPGQPPPVRSYPESDK